MSDKNFTKGMYFERHEKAPEWVVGKISIKVTEFITYLEENKNGGGYVNIDVKISKGNKYYCELNTWTKEDKKETPKPSETEEVNPANINF